jgi:hypothetical protein
VQASAQGLSLKPRVWLEGALDASARQMHTRLQPVLKTQYGVGVPDQAVDRVNVKLLTSDFRNPAAQQQGWLLATGEVVGLDGKALRFEGLTAAKYSVAIEHRSHLPVVSVATVSPGQAQTILLDLTQPAAVVNAVVNASGAAIMPAGDVHHDADRHEINVVDLMRVQAAAQRKATGYVPEDLNLDGVVNERDVRLVEHHNGQLTTFEFSGVNR